MTITTTTDPDRARGLYGKYRVERVDGKDKGPYFVLAPNTDPFAVAALREYAMECEDTHPHLAEDLEKWADRTEELHPQLAYVVHDADESTEEELRYDAARAYGPTLADRLDKIHASIKAAAVQAHAVGNTVRERAFLDALIVIEA